MTSPTAIAAAPQHLRALQRANEVRLARAELKRRVADGELTASEVVLDAPWEAESMAIADLLMSQRRWGRTRCRRFLASVPLSETKTIGSLTERQRRAVAAQLGAIAGRPDDRRPAPAAQRAAPGRGRRLRELLPGSPRASASTQTRVASSTMCPSGSRRYRELKRPRSMISVVCTPRLRR